MSRVNLLPSEIKKGQETRRRFVLFVLAGIALILLVIAFWFFQSMRLSDVQSDIDAQEQTNASLQQEINGLQKYEQLQTEAQQEQQLLDTAYANEVSFSGMLLDVSKVIPSDTYLTNFASTLAAPTAAAGSTSSSSTSTTTTTFVGTMSFSGETLHFASLSTVAEPAGVGPRVGEPVDLERHRRLGGRRGLPVRHVGRPHPGRPDPARRGRSGGFGWITSAPPCSRSSAPSCSPSCSWCSSCCRRWARCRRRRRTSRPPQAKEQTLTVQRNALEDTKANEPENRKIIEQVHHQIPPTADEAGLLQQVNGPRSTPGSTWRRSRRARRPSTRTRGSARSCSR